MQPGQVIGQKYRLTRKVGKGGMGTVWAATDIGLGTPVAVKLLTAEASGSEEMRQRLVREASVATRVRHPNIVHFHEVGLTDDGEPFLVMELLHGQTLRQLIRDRGSLDTPTALWITCEVASALQAAHAAGVVHRDLKPGNVFLNRDASGRVSIKVVDFGVSKILSEDQAVLTSTGAAIGSPAYMSPEQAKGERVDHRTDIWSLGVVLFEMLAGRRPFHADSPVALLSMILFGEVPRLRDFVPDVDPVIDGIVARCLDRRTDARYQTIDQPLSALMARQQAMAEAAAARKEELASWVDMPRPQEPADTSGPAWEPPSQSSSASSSESASSSVAGASQSRSTTHGVAASVRSPELRPDPRPERRGGAPRIPLVAVIIPGMAVAGLFLAVVVLIVRAATRPAPEEPDVIPASPIVNVEQPAPSPVPAPAKTTEVPTPAAALDAGPEAATPEPKVPVTTEPKVPAAPKPTPTAAPPKKPVPYVAPPKPAPQTKACKSPIVDSAGKVIGCLD
jgi:serine/threonine protein kinase